MLKNLQGGSYATRADMKYMLNRCIKDLHTKGYKLSHIKGLKPKHIYVLVEHWKKEGKSPATIKNYMAKLRKVAVIIDKPKLVKANNEAYKLEKRTYIPTYNKAIHQTDFSKCQDRNIRLSLEAQALFGLRREESMKLKIHEAYFGNRLTIKPSWTKGGIGRTIPIQNETQRQWLLEASKQVASGQSLIPKERTYKQHLSHYQTTLKQMGLSRCHGLRHAYAQRRYHELTKQFDKQGKGWQCPLAGGKSKSELNTYQKAIDHRARKILSLELGHSRIAITKIYCG